jgi:predicted PhzF superfamily epimerase YddE/YHI9
MSLPLFHIDAFTDRPFSGNPAAVCLLDGPRNPAWMQNVGAEMNLSETAFTWPEAEGFRLRWFTPTVEVALCGHATLATAHVLWQERRAAPDQTIRFHTASGVLTAARRGEEIELDFPQKPPEEAAPPPGLLEALGVKATWVGQNRFVYLVEVVTENEVRSVQPDFARLLGTPARGVIVTARAESPPYDFISRFFAPGAGINEDPVTGSAHCCLGPYWQKRLHKNELLAYQASRRGGVVRVRLEGERTFLQGRAITVVRGQLVCDD